MFIVFIRSKRLPTVLHGLADVAARANGVGLVVGEIVCENQTQTKAACE